MKQDYVNKMYSYWKICYAFIKNVNRLILEILKINSKTAAEICTILKNASTKTFILKFNI